MNKGTPRRLVRLRKKAGVTRYRVSQDTGIPYTTLVRIETGATLRVNILFLDRLAKYYGKTLSEIF